MNLQTREEWRELLGWIDRALLETDALKPEEQRQFSPQQHARGTLCRVGATSEQIEEAQRRLNCVFPPSYRAFLEVSNGMDAMGFAALPGQLWGTSEIYWMDEGEIEMTVLGWMNEEEHGPIERMKVLSIAEHGDACDLYLCFHLPSANGEVECGFCATWIQGEERFTSFGRRMMSNLPGFYDDWLVAKRLERRRDVAVSPPDLFSIEEALRFWITGVGCKLFPIEAARRWGEVALPSQDTSSPDFFRTYVRIPVGQSWRGQPNPRGKDANKAQVARALVDAMREALAQEPNEAPCLRVWLRELDRTLVSDSLRGKCYGVEGVTEERPADLPDFWQQQNEKRDFCLCLAQELQVKNGQITT